MTAINTILADNWLGTICTEPSFISLDSDSTQFYTRIIGTLIANNDDAVKDAIERKYYDPNSYDGYICEVVSETSEADLKNMIKAIKEVCATYAPTSAENVLDWEPGTYNYWNNMRWEFKFVLLVYKAGIAAY